MLCWVLDRVLEVIVPVEALEVNNNTSVSAVPPTAGTDAGVVQETGESTESSTEATKTRTMLKFKSTCWTELSAAVNESPFLALDCASRIRKPSELRQRVRFEKWIS